MAYWSIEARYNAFNTSLTPVFVPPMLVQAPSLLLRQLQDTFRHQLLEAESLHLSL